jgi:hypothetical protein
MDATKKEEEETCLKADVKICVIMFWRREKGVLITHHKGERDMMMFCCFAQIFKGSSKASVGFSQHNPKAPRLFLHLKRR